MKSVRSEVQVPLAAAGPEETGSWRPSAASALASLVKEEMEALAKPPSAAHPPVSEPVGVGENAPGLAGGLLDLPPPEPVERTNGKSNGANGHRPSLGDAPGEATRTFGPQNPYLSSPGATYSSPAVSQYRPQQDNTKLIAIIAGAVVLVVLIGAGTLVFLKSGPQQVVVQQPTPTPAPTPAPTPTPAPPPTTSAPTTAPTPAPAPNTQAAAATTPKAETPKAEAPKPSGTPHTQVARAEPRERPAPKEKEAPAPKEKEDKEPPGKPKVQVSGGDDEFAAAFGGGGSAKKEAKKDDGPKDDGEKKAKRDVYIPPAPGSGGDVKDSLGQSDIMEVVKANLSAIQTCVAKQREKEPGTSGKLVMKWTILTSGKTAKIEVVSDEYKSTYLASCMTGLIKSWTFPRTKSQGDPVVFPFKF
jgi:hypothetical protein